MPMSTPWDMTGSEPMFFSAMSLMASNTVASGAMCQTAEPLWCNRELTGICVFISLLFLSACWPNLAREIFQENEKPDLLSAGVEFWFHARRLELQAPDRLDECVLSTRRTVVRRSEPNCLQTMETLTTVLLKPGEG